MKMRNVALAVLIGGVCCAVPVLAGEGEGEEGEKCTCREREHRKPERGNREEHFKAADADGNGSLSLAEFKTMHDKRRAMIKERLGDRYDEERAAKMPSAEEIFAKIDADKNGEITKEEMRAAGKHRAERRAKHRPREKKPVEDEE